MKKIIGDYVRKSIDELGNIELVLSVKNYNDKKSIQDLEKGTYSIQISKVKSKRSLQQNALLWKLVHLIAEEQKQDEMEIYIHLLEDTSASYEYLMGLPTIEEELKRNFRAVKVEGTEYFKGKKFHVYKCFVGSSKFDVNEMNMLIDKAMSYCHELDIAIEDDYMY